MLPQDKQLHLGFILPLRRVWNLGKFTTAYSVLEDLFSDFSEDALGRTKEEVFTGLIEGSLTLDGDTEGELVEDHWEPPFAYPTVEQVENWMRKEEENTFYNATILYWEWKVSKVRYTSIFLVRSALSTELYEAYDQAAAYIDAVPDHIWEDCERAGKDLDWMFEIQDMNFSGLSYQSTFFLNEFDNSPCGFIAPNGDFYSCPQSMHTTLQMELEERGVFNEKFVVVRGSSYTLQAAMVDADYNATSLQKEVFEKIVECFEVKKVENLIDRS